MPDSLWGSDSDADTDNPPSPTVPPALHALPPPLVASSAPPPIPGLYHFPGVLPVELQHALTEALSAKVWTGHSNQVMLFDSPTRSTMPPYLKPLLDLLPTVLSSLPDAVKASLFEHTTPRQAILNLYFPGQGISPHVDLPTRYADGIIGISLLGSTAMDFSPASSPSASSPTEPPPAYALRLRPGDVYVLSGEARWDWTHGIAYREEDLVEDEQGHPMRVRRGVRMSITLRRMKEGAELLGLEEEGGGKVEKDTGEK
ncbi:hypothetical protein JCM10207_004625 [Rhodosporidiobolus poonsookiae]